MNKQTKKAKKTTRKMVKDENTLKTIDRLEKIKKDLVIPIDGQKVDSFRQLVGSAPAPGTSEGEEAGTKNKLIIEVVHVNDRGERIEPTEKEKEISRRLEGKKD